MDDRFCHGWLVLTVSITLTESQKQVLLKHVAKFNPNESCAILYGVIRDGQARVEDIFLTQNADESPVSFTIPDEELIAAYQRIKDNNTDMVGIFHSHPNSAAVPSKTDLSFMEINPVIWVIYSGSDGDFRAYILDGDAREIRVIIAD